MDKQTKLLILVCIALSVLIIIGAEVIENIYWNSVPPLIIGAR